MGRPRAVLTARIAELEANSGQAGQAVIEDLRRTVQAMRDCRPNVDTPAARKRAQDALEILPPKWAEIFGRYDYHPTQANARTSTARYRAIEAGRRSGKTADRKAEIVERALDPDWFIRHGLSQRFLAVGLPTQQQTRDLYLDDLIALIPRRFLAGEPRYSDPQLIRTVAGGRIKLAGMDRPQRAEGEPIDDLFLDEVADMRLGRAVIDRHLRPSLSTRGRPPGSVTAYGTTDMVSGSEFVELCDAWLTRHQEGDSDYAYFHWSSQGIISDEEWERQRTQLDPATFAVEYEARRVSTGDLAYWCFRRNEHIVPAVRINPTTPAILCFDWNVRPGTATILQEQSVEDYTTADPLPENIADDFTAVLGEVFLRNNGQAPRVVGAAIQKLRELGHRGPVFAYGDPAGGASHAAATEGTCLEHLRKLGREACGDRFSMRFRKSAPAIVARLNAVNGRLRSADEQVRMVVHPSCTETIKDFEQVHIEQAKTGAIQIEKATSGPKKDRTHLTDGLGYYVAAEFPSRTRTGLVDADIGL